MCLFFNGDKCPELNIHCLIACTAISFTCSTFCILLSSMQNRTGACTLLNSIYLFHLNVADIRIRNSYCRIFSIATFKITCFSFRLIFVYSDFALDHVEQRVQKKRTLREERKNGNSTSFKISRNNSHTNVEHSKKCYLNMIYFVHSFFYIMAESKQNQLVVFP